MKLSIVMDTNIYLQALSNPESRQMAVLSRAIEGKILLFSPDTVKEELERNLLKFNLTGDRIEKIMDSLPVEWIEFELYMHFLKEAGKLIAHKADIPVVATTLFLNTGILSMDKDFNRRDLKQRIKIWDLDELMKLPR